MVSASASDNVAVASVEFLIDNTVIGTDATAPYSIAASQERMRGLVVPGQSGLNYANNLE